MSGYLLRQTQRQLAAAAAPCPFCGHLVQDHREYQREDPAYRPLLFRCVERGCGCEMDSSPAPVCGVRPRTEGGAP